MAHAIRDWRCVLLIAALLFPIAVTAQTNKTVFVSVQAKQDIAATAKYGSGEDQAIAGMLETFIDDALNKKFPCIHLLDRSAVITMLNYEKGRALLGNPDDSAWEKIGANVGAGYLVSVSVQVNGDKVLINGEVLDSTKSKGISALSRADTVSAGGTAAYGPIKQFAQNLVNGISGGPQCSGDWAGTVTVTFKTNASGTEAGNQVSESGSGTLTCQVTGAGQDAKCSYHSTDVLSGNNRSMGFSGSMTTTKTATDASTWVSIGIAGGKLALSFGAIPVTVTVEGPIPIDPSTESVNGGSYILPATSDPKHQTGLWTDPNGGSRGSTVVTWDLSRR
jgi:hypothetical protein